ncbi:MAG: type IV secretion system protein [Erythrobacter sp.]|uniref:type IV secretion system protein n=1 Tax=Erythrobacter sp. TaxID=1042 RepID=UPI00261FD038|nr:type IV secretion system protein [Erythrobacter sp.]MDJ0978607.1 type IV secretion system protein [Erythrobacter sp.]
MATSCDLVAQEVGAGVSAALTAVDCIASEVSEQAFGQIFGSEGQMSLVLTILLTFYVAFFGISLMLGRSNLSIRALVPRIMTIGLVVTFATSFAAFSAVFYNIFVETPDWLAGVLTKSEGSATATFAQKLDVVFIAVQEASTGQTDINMFSPPGMMWLGALLLLLGTVGLLVTARIGLALLLAVGPIFVVMALFNQTRGLFVGWLKGMLMLSLAPLFAVVGGSIMLEMAVPILAALIATPGEINQQAAMAFFVVGFVHCMLMLMALLTSSIMVSKWQVFGFAPTAKEVEPSFAPTAAPVAQAPIVADRAARTAPPVAAAAVQRRAEVAPASAIAANDTGPATTTVRQTKVYASTAQGGGSASTRSGPSRTRGIGNRFKSAPASSRSPAKRN